jgi:hypothetical protein
VYLKECYFDFGQLDIIDAGKVRVFILNGQRELHLGDIIGGRMIVNIKLNDMETDTLPIGMRGEIELNGMPILTISGPYTSEEFD